LLFHVSESIKGCVVVVVVAAAVFVVRLIRLNNSTWNLAGHLNEFQLEGKASMTSPLPPSPAVAAVAVVAVVAVVVVVAVLSAH